MVDESRLIKIIRNAKQLSGRQLTVGAPLYVTFITHSNVRRGEALCLVTES